MRARLQIKRYFATQHFGRQLKAVLVAQQYGEHIAWQFFFANVTAFQFRQQSLAARDGGL